MESQVTEDSQENIILDQSGSDSKDSWRVFADGFGEIECCFPKIRGPEVEREVDCHGEQVFCIPCHGSLFDVECTMISGS